MKTFLLLALILFLLSACSSIDAIRVSEYPVRTWVAYSDSQFEFSGKFVAVEYVGVKTVGLRLEEPLGPGWKVFKIKEGDVWMGMADLVFFRSEDWKKAWVIVRHRLGQEVITVGILKYDGDGSYAKELQWMELRHK